MNEDVKAIRKSSQIEKGSSNNWFLAVAVQPNVRVWVVADERQTTSQLPETSGSQPTFEQLQSVSKQSDISVQTDAEISERKKNKTKTKLSIAKTEALQSGRYNELMIAYGKRKDDESIRGRGGHQVNDKCCDLA